MVLSTILHTEMYRNQISKTEQNPSNSFCRTSSTECTGELRIRSSMEYRVTQQVAGFHDPHQKSRNVCQLEISMSDIIIKCIILQTEV